MIALAAIVFVCAVVALLGAIVVITAEVERLDDNAIE